MIPQHAIIEIVCTLHSVTPAQIKDTLTRTRRIVDCQHLLIIALSKHTRISVHQTAELLGYDLQRIKYALAKYRDSLPGDTIIDKYLIINQKLNEYEKDRLLESDNTYNLIVPALSKYDKLLIPDVYHKRVG